MAHPAPPTAAWSGPPMTNPAGAEPGAGMRRRMAGFFATLRSAGFKVGLAETADAVRLLATPGAARPSRLRPALKHLACADHRDWTEFDALFDAFWLNRGTRRVARVSPGVARDGPSLKTLNRSAPSSGEGTLPDQTRRDPGVEQDNPADGRGRREGASREARLAATDIRHIADPADIAATHRLAERLARAMRTRLTRRDHVRRTGPRLDLRRTLHQSIAQGGEPLRLAFRRRRDKPLRLVILLDASGSMEMYTAFFVRFIHAVVASFAEAEAFVFHTRLVHVSEALRERNAGRAVERLALMAQGIGGGTKIGESLALFNRWHARRVIHGRTCVMIVSDGYDTGDPGAMGREMARLRRRCRRIVWLNPLIGWADYQPTAQGMAAALPFVDLFAPAHNLESLAALEPYLARI